MKLVYSDLIVAYGQGRTVQFQDCTLKDPTEWNDLGADNTVVWPSLLRTDGQPSVRFKFRIKPHTVKIGSREVEAPVLEPVEDQPVYWMSASGIMNDAEFDPESHRHVSRAAAGRLFASPEAAEAFHNASVAYVLEQLK